MEYNEANRGLRPPCMALTDISAVAIESLPILRNAQKGHLGGKHIATAQSKSLSMSQQFQHLQSLNMGRP